MKDFVANLADFGENRALNEVEIYMRQKGIEYRTIDKSRAGRIYAELKAHIKPPKRVIQVLGTNGKGSTGRFIAQILAQSGYKILHFTSPHIFSFNERFYDNNGIVSDESLTKAHRFLQNFAFANECSYFEYATFLALVLAQGVDFAILEAGVGGELDSTSVAKRDLCVFSVVDYDHTDILGDSIEAIATTKLNAVFYPNLVPKMLLGAQKYEIVEKIAKDIAKTHSVEIFAVDSHQNESLLRGSEADEAIQNQSCDSTESRPLRGAKNREQGCSSATADFLLEAEKRGSPPKSEKRELLGIQLNSRGELVRGAALLRENSSESNKQNDENLADSHLRHCDSYNLDLCDLDGCFTSFANPADCFDFDKSKSRNDGLVADLRDLDSSLVSLAQNDGFGVNCHNSQSESCNDKIHIESYIQKHRLAPFLAQNLALALKATQIFGINANLDSLPKLDLRARFEQIAPNITIDVGHNENAALAIKQNLGDKKIILVYNSYFQKNIARILGILKDNILRVEILKVSDNPRIIEQKELEGILDSLQIAHRNFTAIDSGENYLVFGSFSVVEAFMRNFINGAKLQ